MVENFAKQLKWYDVSETFTVGIELNANTDILFKEEIQQVSQVKSDKVAGPEGLHPTNYKECLIKVKTEILRTLCRVEGFHDE